MRKLMIFMQLPSDSRLYQDFSPILTAMPSSFMRCESKDAHGQFSDPTGGNLKSRLNFLTSWNPNALFMRAPLFQTSRQQHDILALTKTHFEQIHGTDTPLAIERWDVNYA